MESIILKIELVHNLPKWSYPLRINFICDFIISILKSEIT